MSVLGRMERDYRDWSYREAKDAKLVELQEAISNSKSPSVTLRFDSVFGAGYVTVQRTSARAMLKQFEGVPRWQVLPNGDLLIDVTNKAIGWKDW